MKATRFDVARAHSLCVRIESLRREYMDMSEEFRNGAEEQFEAENQFLNILERLDRTAQDTARIAEESKQRMPLMDCCSLPAEIF